MSKQINNKQTLTLLSKKTNTDKLATFLTEFVKASDIPNETHNDLRLIIEEAFINIVSYAYGEQGYQPVTIELRKHNNSISITFTDSGTAFNPLTDATEYKSTDDHCEGGMGIHFITSLTDQQEYHRVNQTNVFTLTKHYTRQN